jgi:hypothetical protein
MPGNPEREKRLRPRAKISCLVRVRPSSPMDNAFDEVLSTENSSRDGCYFATRNLRYRQYMRLFIAFPYSSELGAINREYVAEILRVDELPDSRRGVAVKFVTTITLSDQKAVPIYQINAARRLWRANAPEPELPAAPARQPRPVPPGVFYKPIFRF